MAPTRIAPVALALFSTIVPRLASAADPIAESMFQEALEMMRQGNIAEACPRLEASQRLEAKSGTLIVLGSCYEKIGRSASAWAQYKEAAAMARAEGREEHTNKATELARSIEPRLSKLRIDAEMLQGGAQLIVKLDGRVVLAGQLGVAFAIDPGEHTVTASAPGRAMWTHTVVVAAENDAQVVAIPKLAPLAARSAKSARLAAPEPSADTTTASGPHIPVWAWVAGGAGVALTGVAIGFAVDQHNAAGEIEDQCGSARDQCPPSFDLESARGREERGFGLFIGLGIAGLAGMGAGIAGAVLAVSEDGAPAAWMVPSPTGLGIAGRF